MFARILASSLERRGVHYAWVVAAVTFFSLLTTSAALGLPGAMLRPLSTEFGWSTEQLSSVFATRIALFGLLGPFSALFIARFGLPRVMALAVALIALSMVAVTQVTHLWQLFVLWGVVLGTGTGLTALVLGAIVASRWFSAHRGLVMGLFAASSATGQLLFLPLAAWLIEHHGWRMAVLPVFVACLVAAVLAATLMRSDPRELGLKAYGEGPGTGRPEALPAPAPLDLAVPFRWLREVRGNRTFWMLAGTFFICGLSTNGLIQTHFIALCGDNGLGAVPAASVLSMMGAFDLIGTTLSGYLSDRFDSRKLLFWYYGLRGLALFWLPFSQFTFYGLSMFALFYGLDWIATVPPTVKLATQAFGKERGGAIFGWVFASHMVGASVAAYGAGLSRTLLLTYNPALYVAGAACLVAASMAMMIRLQRRPVPVAA